MLSLKSLPFRQFRVAKFSIYDLPTELFDFIVEQLVDHVPITSALSSVSLVSRRFRRAAIAILFQRISITLTCERRRHGEPLLDFLLRNPHIQACVREVYFAAPMQDQTRQVGEYEKLRQLLPQLKGLRHIELDYLGSDLELLQIIASIQQAPRVDIKDLSLQELSVARRHAIVEALQSIPNVKALDLRGRIPGPLVTTCEQTAVCNVQDMMNICPQLESLSLMVQPSYTIMEGATGSSSYLYNHPNDDRVCLRPLKTLHIDGRECLTPSYQEECLTQFTAFDWSSIEELCLAGDFLTETFLPRIGDKLIKLRSLRISVFGLPGIRTWVASARTLQGLTDFLAARQLTVLELDGFSKDLPIGLIASPKLQKLRLHSWELDPRTALANLRSAQDIRLLANLAPNLRHLMLDVAHVEKLWHPTAIPGVDVDIHLYHVLDALSKFPRLKTLHLFPRYYSSPPRSEREQWSQALADDGQAVQIFKHLKAIQPSLEQLILSSDTMVARLGEISPMMWTVCQLGKCILLRLRRAGSGYEQKQIWFGQRRLRTESKTDGHLKPYLEGVGPRIWRRWMV